MIRVQLTQEQIDWIAKACVVAVDERASFLRDEARFALAGALAAMNRPGEAAFIEPERRRSDPR